MKIDRHIEKLSLRDLQQRRDALSEILSDEGINFFTDDYSDGINNFAFRSGCESSGYLFVAHYDNFHGSYGANDNMAAVCILIDLCHALNTKGITADFVLTDGEENNHSGSVFYCENHDIRKFHGIINLDLCGYGDTVIIHGHGHENNSRLSRFTNKLILTKHNAQLVKYMPESEDIIFRRYHVPTLSVAIIPRWDVQYLKALASFGERLLGQPPEFNMIISQMEITQTIHNNFKDKPEFVQHTAMQKVYDYLLEAMTTEYNTENFSLINSFRRLIT